MSTIDDKIDTVSFILNSFFDYSNEADRQSYLKQSVAIRPNIKTYFSFTTVELNSLLVSLESQKISPAAQKISSNDISMFWSAQKISSNDISMFWSALCRGVIKSDRLWTLKSDTQWIGSVEVFYNRSCYDDLIAVLKGKSRGLVIGTPGIGKTMFLQRLITQIYEDSINSRVSVPSIVYLRRELGGHNGIIKQYFLTLDSSGQGEVYLYDETIHPAPDYYLSDSIDLHVALGKVLSLLVASDKEDNYNEFKKRIKESEHALNYVMPLFSFEELKCIRKYNLDDQQCQFLYDIFGGSARNFHAVGSYQTSLPQVESMLRLFFSDFQSLYPDLWQRAHSAISHELCKDTMIDGGATLVSGLNTINSLIRHRSDVTDSHVWASKFMEMLCGSLEEASQINIWHSLKSILGDSVKGIAFESSGHKKLVNSPHDYHAKSLSNEPNKYAFIMLPISQVNQICLIRSIADIEGIPDNNYGLPIIPNFPLVDAIIQPDILLQFTVSPVRHVGALDDLHRIRSMLREKDQTKHKMIFVIDQANVNSFIFHNELNSISQYITFAEYVQNRENLMSKKERSAFKSKCTREANKRLKK